MSSIASSPSPWLTDTVRWWGYRLGSIAHDIAARHHPATHTLLTSSPAIAPASSHFSYANHKEITMGWLYMQSLDGYSGPRQYLDAQFTYQRPTVTSRVLRSALVKMRVYYAAIEHVLAATGKREVWGAVCLVAYNPRDREGYIFGYKDMTRICRVESPGS
jgi:hypothetical protein